MAILMTAEKLIERVKAVQKTPTVYMWGTYGQVLDNALIDYKAKQYPTHNTPARVVKHKKLVGKGYSAWDCVGLIKGVFWGWEEGKSPKYRGNPEVPDAGSDSMFNNYCVERSVNFKNIVAGEAVWLKGHIGVYIGDGLVIEATSRATGGFTDNVLISALGNIGTVKGYPTRSWTHHGKLKWVDYTEKSEPEPKPDMDYIEHKVIKGDTPWGLAIKYLGKGNRYTEIMSFNGLRHDDNIYIGQILKIPVECPQSEPPINSSTVRVNTPRGLNIRKSAPNGSVIKTLPNGTIVEITKEESGWGYSPHHGGWLSLAFTIHLDGIVVPPSLGYNVRVNTPIGLNIRSNPVTGIIIGVLNYGQTVRIMEEKNGWGRIETPKGWIALSYTVKA